MIYIYMLHYMFDIWEERGAARPCKGGRLLPQGRLQGLLNPELSIQGYLAHKKVPPPRTLQQAYA